MRRFMLPVIESFVAALFVLATAADAQTNCKAIKDDRERLACYDAAGKAPSPLPRPKPETPDISSTVETVDARYNYAKALERVFLSSGTSMSVFVSEKTARFDRGPPPTLIFFGYISKAFVYQVITTGQVLERAKELGFKTVDFTDKGPDGRYIFDLSKPGDPPQCALNGRVCR